MAARPVIPKVLADKRIKSEIEPDKKEQEKQYEDVLEKIKQRRQALCHLK